jgi:hypothetical protein
MNMGPDKRVEVVLFTGGEWSCSHLGYLTAGKRAPDILGDWVAPRASLDTV